SIPNREVKPANADGTASQWESRKLPDFNGRYEQRTGVRQRQRGRGSINEVQDRYLTQRGTNRRKVKKTGKDPRTLRKRRKRRREWDFLCNNTNR
ncbi:hypothetical protein EZS27_034683, partial [termite gut metagenome]